MGLILCACGVVIWVHVARWSHRGHPKKTGPVVCIDPGHPSETNSARHHVNGTCELDMNWEMAHNVAAALGRRGIRAVITKKTCDQFLRNRERALIANDCQADLTLHLHCDAGPGRGYTIYFPDKQGTIEGKTGPEQEIIDSSHDAAEVLHAGMMGVLRGWLHDRGIKGDSDTKIGRRKGTLTWSAFSEVPTLTIEMCFLTNRHDAEFIKSEHGKQRLTNAMAAGVIGYLKSLGYHERGGKLRARG